MPIVPPLLDDRTWQELRDEAIARIPVYAPEWTDVREGDPGVALVEVFAFLTESLIYRLNRVPDASYLAFLNLLDAPPRPAEPSRGVVQLGVKPFTAPGDSALVPLGSTLSAGKVKFSTTGEVHVLPVDVAAFLKCAVPEPDANTDARAYADAAKQAYTDAHGKDFSAVHYVTKPYPPEDGSAVAVSNAIDGALWFALLARADDVAGLEGPALAAAMDAIRGELGGKNLSLGFIPTDVATDAAPEPCAAPTDPNGNRALASVPDSPWRWEISAPRAPLLAADEEPQYGFVQLIEDTTRSLRQPGIVRLKLPPKERLTTWTSVDPGDGTPVPLSTFPRAGDMPPFLDDGDVENRVIAWLRAVPRNKVTIAVTGDSGSVQAAFTWLGANAVDVVQSLRVTGENVGVGTGEPGLVLQLGNAPVLARSLALTVEEDGIPRPWQEVESFDASDARAAHYLLDRALGAVRFGDGLQGRVVPDGAVVRADYAYGGGLVGNVPSSAIDKLESAPAPIDMRKVTNPRALAGGSETETVDQLRRRVPMSLRHQNRAVTADDFRELATLTPGAAVGRAEVLPLYRPKHPSTEKYPGVVTVLVIPAEDPAHPRAPEPDRSFREAVCTYLDARRLITTELYVIGPRYVKIGVSIGLQTKPGTGLEQLANWVNLALRQFLAPLPPFGPDGAGWPLGGKINRAAIEAAALQVDGVSWIDEITLRRQNADGTYGPDVPLIDLDVIELPELVAVEIDLGTAPPLTPEPPTGGVPIPVPVPRTVC
jgi:predicted phage baseplate assembly protein